MSWSACPGLQVRLADDAGRVQTVLASELADGTRFGVPSPVSPRGPRPETGLEGLPAAAVEEASWWEAHIAEVVYGLRPDAPAGTRPRPQYDPERTSLTEREKAKAAELSAAGKKVPASTVKHRRQRWEAHGLPGLADRRLSRRRRPAGRADDQVVAAMREAIGETPDASSRTAGFTIWRMKEILAGAGYDGPCRRTGRFTGCSARCRTDGTPRGRHRHAGRWRAGRGNVRVAAGGGAGRGRADRLHPAGRAGAAGRRRPGPGRADRDDRRRPPGWCAAAVLRPTTRSVDAERAAGPRADARADAAGLDRGPEDGALGAALRAAAGRSTSGWSTPRPDR